MWKQHLLGAALWSIGQSGLSAVMQPLWGGQGVIFCLHHVCPGGGQQTGFAPNSNLEITPEFLATIIKVVQGMGYELVSLDDALKRMGAPARPFAVFTLDDAYKDNLHHARPVFQRFNCPFTVYACPDLCDGEGEMWWRGVEAMIATNDRLALDMAGQRLTLNCATEAEKWQAWRTLAPLVRALPEDEQRIWLRQTAPEAGVDLKQQCRTAVMDWDELRQLASDPLASIGAHTNGHFNLLKLSTEAAAHEIRSSGARIAVELGRPVQHFAFPYGNKDAAGPREFQLAREAGYASAVVTRLGPVHSKHAAHPHALPRLMISGRYQNAATIKALMSGVPSRLSNGFRPLNVG